MADSNEGLVKTPITDKNGVATTRNKKVASTTSGTSRVAALTAKPKPVKLTTIKKPASGWHPNVKDTDVVELGPQKPDAYANEQDVYLNGKAIGVLHSNEERQHSPIKGTRLVRPLAKRKVWRGAASVPKAEGVLDAQTIRSDDFSRAKAVYDLVNSYNRGMEITHKQEAYAANGGIYFTYIRDGSRNRDWYVNGKLMPAPEGTELTIRAEAGTLTKSVLITPHGRPWERAELYFGSAQDDGTPLVYKLGEGKYNFYSFERDGSLWAHQGVLALDAEQAGFIAKVEAFSMAAFAANKD